MPQRSSSQGSSEQSLSLYAAATGHGPSRGKRESESFVALPPVGASSPRRSERRPSQGSRKAAAANPSPVAQSSGAAVGLMVAVRLGVRKHGAKLRVYEAKRNVTEDKVAAMLRKLQEQRTKARLEAARRRHNAGSDDDPSGFGPHGKTRGNSDGDGLVTSDDDAPATSNAKYAELRWAQRQAVEEAQAAAAAKLAASKALPPIRGRARGYSMLSSRRSTFGGMNDAGNGDEANDGGDGDGPQRLTVEERIALKREAHAEKLRKEIAAMEAKLRGRGRRSSRMSSFEGSEDEQALVKCRGSRSASPIRSMRVALEAARTVRRLGGDPHKAHGPNSNCPECRKYRLALETGFATPVSKSLSTSQESQVPSASMAGADSMGISFVLLNGGPPDSSAAFGGGGDLSMNPSMVLTLPARRASVARDDSNKPLKHASSLLLGASRMSLRHSRRRSTARGPSDASGGGVPRFGGRTPRGSMGSFRADAAAAGRRRTGSFRSKKGGNNDDDDDDDGHVSASRLLGRASGSSGITPFTGEEDEQVWSDYESDDGASNDGELGEPATSTAIMSSSLRRKRKSRQDRSGSGNGNSANIDGGDNAINGSNQANNSAGGGNSASVDADGAAKKEARRKKSGRRASRRRNHRSGDAGDEDGENDDANSGGGAAAEDAAAAAAAKAAERRLLWLRRRVLCAMARVVTAALADAASAISDETAAIGDGTFGGCWPGGGSSSADEAAAFGALEDAAAEARALDAQAEADPSAAAAAAAAAAAQRSRHMPGALRRPRSDAPLVLLRRACAVAAFPVEVANRAIAAAANSGPSASAASFRLRRIAAASLLAGFAAATNVLAFRTGEAKLSDSDKDSSSGSDSDEASKKLRAALRKQRLRDAARAKESAARRAACATRTLAALAALLRSVPLPPWPQTAPGTDGSGSKNNEGEDGDALVPNHSNGSLGHVEESDGPATLRDVAVRGADTALCMFPTLASRRNYKSNSSEDRSAAQEPTPPSHAIHSTMNTNCSQSSFRGDRYTAEERPLPLHAAGGLTHVPLGHSFEGANPNNDSLGARAPLVPWVAHSATSASLAHHPSPPRTTTADSSFASASRFRMFFGAGGGTFGNAPH